MAKRLHTLLAAFLLPMLAFAQDPGVEPATGTAAPTLDEKIQAVFEPITAVVESIVFFPVTDRGYSISLRSALADHRRHGFYRLHGLYQHHGL